MAALDVRVQVRDGLEGRGGEAAQTAEAFTERARGDGAPRRREHFPDLHRGWFCVLLDACARAAARGVRTDSWLQRQSTGLCV